MKTDGILEAIKDLATDKDGLNVACYRLLLELFGRDRIDIIKSIKKLHNSAPYKYTPDVLADQLKNIDKLIIKYDAIYNDKNIEAEYAEQAYIQKKIAYDVGESLEDPDAE